jgi:PKD repeat protein
VAEPERPDAGFAVRPHEPSPTESIQLFDCSHDPRKVGIAWRAWDFGDGSTGVGSSPVHRYAHAGRYTVTLTLATFDGRVGCVTQVVDVRRRSERHRHALGRP